MRLLRVGFFLASLFLSSAFPVGAQQSSAPAQATKPAADPIVGAWKMNMEKSDDPGVESELITITPQGDQFQIIIQAMQSNKYNPHYEVVTDMKGTISKPTASGQPMNDAWRFTRKEINVFVEESVGPFGGPKKEYTVSADGRTLTVRELPGNSRIIAGKVDSSGVFHPVQHLRVFEKMSDSEGRALSQWMVDTDAAQKAAGAKYAAEQAARDAVACSLSGGQNVAPESSANQNAWHEYVCPADGSAISLPHAPGKQSLGSVNSYNLYTTEDASIVTQLWVSAKSVDCGAWLREMRTKINHPPPPPFPGLVPIPGTGPRETTFQGNPAFESVNSGPKGKYEGSEVTECVANRTYRFNARWLSDNAKPEEINRIFNSFRLVAEEKKQ